MWEEFVWESTLQDSLHTVRNDLAVSSKTVAFFLIPLKTISMSPLNNKEMNETTKLQM